MTGLEKLEGLKTEIDTKKLELEQKNKCEIKVFAFATKDDCVIGYLKDPDRLTKMRAIDMYEQSRTQAGDIILRSGLIQEESDSRILEEKKENDPFYLGAIDFAVKSVGMYLDVLKKK